MEWNKYFSGDVVEVECVVRGRREPRPAVVVSPKGYQRAFDEVVVCAVGAASQAEAERLMMLHDWQTTGLDQPVGASAMVRMVPITDVARKTGELSERDRRALRMWLGQALGLFGDAAEDEERIQEEQTRQRAAWQAQEEERRQRQEARHKEREREEMEKKLRASAEREERRLREGGQAATG